MCARVPVQTQLYLISYPATNARISRPRQPARASARVCLYLPHCMKYRDRPCQDMRQWRRAQVALLACACATLVLVRGSPLFMSGRARGGDEAANDASPTTATTNPSPLSRRAALCGACPTRAVTDPGEPARAMVQDADHPTIWLTSTLGTGRTCVAGQRQSGAGWAGGRTRAREFDIGCGSLSQKVSLTKRTPSLHGFRGNIIKRLNRAIVHAHACKALLFLPETDNWGSFQPPPASRVMDFRGRPGGRHPRCSGAETRRVNSLNLKIEYGLKIKIKGGDGGGKEGDIGGVGKNATAALNWRLETPMTYWSWAMWQVGPMAGWDDVAGNPVGRVIWFSEAAAAAAGIAGGDRAALYEWRNATDALTTTCLRHYLGFCEPGFCEGGNGFGDGADTTTGQTTLAGAEAGSGRAALSNRGMQGGGASGDAPPAHFSSPLPRLAVHIRQGDIYPPHFGATRWTGNGQPPLSYYLAALGHRSWGRVDVLAELGVPEGPAMAGLRMLRAQGALPSLLTAPATAAMDGHGLDGAAGRPVHDEEVGREQQQQQQQHDRYRPFTTTISTTTTTAQPPVLVFPDERPSGSIFAAVATTMDGQITAANARSEGTSKEAAAAWRADIQKMVCSDAVVIASSSTASIAGLGFAATIYSPVCQVAYSLPLRTWAIQWDHTDGTTLSLDKSTRSGTWRPPYQVTHNNSAAEWAGALLTPAAAPAWCGIVDGGRA